MQDGCDDTERKKFEHGTRVVLWSADREHRVPGYVWGLRESRYVRVVVVIGFVGEMAKPYELVEDGGEFFYRSERVEMELGVLLPHEARRVEKIEKALEPEEESRSISHWAVALTDVVDREIRRIGELLQEITEGDRARYDTWNYVEACDWFNQAFDLTGGEKPLGFFNEKWNVFRFRTDEQRSQFVKLRARMPRDFKKYFKSKREAYRKSREFLEVGRKNRFGYTVLAKDGHVCNSIGEARIDDYLFEKGVAHIREPHYPGNSNWRADFLIGRYYVEFFGLAGNKAYDRKTYDKIQYARKLGIELIEIYPSDLDDGGFASKLEPAIRGSST